MGKSSLIMYLELESLCSPKFRVVLSPLLCGIHIGWTLVVRIRQHGDDGDENGFYCMYGQPALCNRTSSPLYFYFSEPPIIPDAFSYPNLSSPGSCNIEIQTFPSFSMLGCQMSVRNLRTERGSVTKRLSTHKRPQYAMCWMGRGNWDSETN